MSPKSKFFVLLYPLIKVVMKPCREHSQLLWARYLNPEESLSYNKNTSWLYKEFKACSHPQSIKIYHGPGIRKVITHIFHLRDLWKYLIGNWMKFLFFSPGDDPGWPQSCAWFDLPESYESEWNIY